jgi:transcriptional regulator with XRE-family HTH domain
VSDLLVHLGKRIHDLRASRNWSQEEFAHVGGFHRTYVGQIERGEKNMSFDNLAKVADALGVTMSTLLDGLENGTETTVKLPRAEAGGRPLKEAAHQVLEARKLVKRLKLQHAEMSRTILALEDLPAKGSRGPKPSRRTPSK